MKEIFKNFVLKFLWQGIFIFPIKIGTALILSWPIKYQLIDVYGSVFVFILLFIFLSLFFWAIIFLINNRKRALFAFIITTIAAVLSFIIYYDFCGGPGIGGGLYMADVCVPVFQYFILNPIFYFLSSLAFFMLILFIIAKIRNKGIYATNKFRDIILTIIAIIIVVWISYGSLGSLGFNIWETFSFNLT